MLVRSNILAFNPSICTVYDNSNGLKFRSNCENMTWHEIVQFLILYILYAVLCTSFVTFITLPPIKPNIGIHFEFLSLNSQVIPKLVTGHYSEHQISDLLHVSLVYTN